MKRWITLLLIVLFALVISACSDNGNEDPDTDIPDDNGSEESDTDIPDSDGDNPNQQNEGSVESPQEKEHVEDEVTVTINDVDDNEVAEATLTQVDDGVKVKLTGDGLSDGDEHAFHVHENGVCAPDDFESAGGHYNPTDKNHGKEDPDGPHAGDFDNIEVGEDGEIDVEFVTDQISLDKDAENTVFTEEGTSLVIHADSDDYKSQPAGDAGDRIACGVIAEPQ